MPRRGHGPRLRWRREQWVIRWTDAGRTRERRTGAADRAAAEAALADFLTEQRQRPSGPRRPDHYLVPDLLSEYAEEHGSEVASPDTLARNVERLLDWWSSATIADVTKASCQGYTKHRRAQNIGDNTIRRELSVLSAALGHAVAAGRIQSRPQVWMPSPGPGRERWLTRGEAARLLRAARRIKRSRAHLPLFILLGLYGGARRGAILDLRWPQVDLERGVIDWNPPGRAQTAKGRSKVPIVRPLRTFLRLAYRRRSSDLGHVIEFRGQPVAVIQKGFKRAARDAGLSDVSTHTLRHTCGTWLAQAGVPLWEVAGYLGHTMGRTTELYAHHHPEHMEGPVRAFGGRRR